MSDISPASRREERTVVAGDDVRVRRTRVRGDTAAAHAAFGGIDIPASLSGMVAAVGLAVLLSGLAGALGTVGYQLGVSGASKLSVGGLIAGLVILILSFLFGGWVAGRMARYDGIRNGLLAAVWFLVLAALLGGLGGWLGTKYNFLTEVHLPQWFSSNATSGTAIASGIVALLVVLGSAMLGGWLGTRYHRRADEAIAATTTAGLPWPDDPAETGTRRVIRTEAPLATTETLIVRGDGEPR